MNPRTRVAGIAAALSLAGCGAPQGGGLEDPEAEAVAAVVRSQAAAIAAGDGARACSHFSPRGRRQIEALARERPEVRATGCEAAVEETARELPAAARDALAEPVVSGVRVERSHATATVEPPADLKELALAAGVTDVAAELRLVESSGRWKVDWIALPGR